MGEASWADEAQTPDETELLGRSPGSDGSMHPFRPLCLVDPPLVGPRQSPQARSLIAFHQATSLSATGACSCPDPRGACIAAGISGKRPACRVADKAMMLSFYLVLQPFGACLVKGTSKRGAKEQNGPISYL